MLRLWLMLIPMLAPIALLAGWYLLEVVPLLCSDFFFYESFLQRLSRASSTWWNGHFGGHDLYGGGASIELLYLWCGLAFLGGCIVAIALHLMLVPRHPGRTPEDR